VCRLDFQQIASCSTWSGGAKQQPQLHGLMERRDLHSSTSTQGLLRAGGRVQVQTYLVPTLENFLGSFEDVKIFRPTATVTSSYSTATCPQTNTNIVTTIEIYLLHN